MNINSTSLPQPKMTACGDGQDRWLAAMPGFCLFFVLGLRHHGLGFSRYERGCSCSSASRDDRPRAWSCESPSPPPPASRPPPTGPDSSTSTPDRPVSYTNHRAHETTLASE